MTSSRRYTLIVLTIYFAIAHADRQIVSIVLEPIGREFSLSDIQLGLLSGPAFALFFSVLGLPFAVAATVLNRRNLIAATIAAWSVMTMLCGVAQSYMQLFLARVGVGVGEAGALPSSHAVLSDLYAPRERATAMGVFMSGANIGVALALLVGGAVAQLHGWRVAVLVIGFPGLLLAVLIRFTVAEPPRSAGALTGEGGLAMLRATASRMWRQRPLRLMLFGAVLNAITSFGVLAWLPTFLIRVHGIELGAVGLYLALSIGLGGALGTMLAGRLSDRFARRAAAWLCWTPALFLLVSKPFAIAGFLADLRMLALGLLIVPFAFGAAYMASTISVLHGGVEASERPMASAIMLLCINLLGMGIGPLFVGTVSDLWPSGGVAAGLVALQSFGIAGIVLIFLAGRHQAGSADEAAPAAISS